MKVIIPVAGVGSRLRPHTYSLPKPLLEVAGRRIIDHVLRPLENLDVDELIMVVGSMGEMIKEYVSDNYSWPIRFVQQESLLGLGAALNMALEGIDESPLLIILGDTIIDCDLSEFVSSGDYVLGLRQVPDPQRFGIAEINGNKIIGLEEKPTAPKTDLALIGLYYFGESGSLVKTLGKHVKSGKLTSGEIQFTDALEAMIKNGTEFTPFEVKQWYDCGTCETLLATNAYFLSRNKEIQSPSGTIIIPPVYVSPSAKIADSVIGPNVSIGEDVVIQNSIIRNSIISKGATLNYAMLRDSIIGSGASVKGSERVLNIGDSAQSECS